MGWHRLTTAPAAALAVVVAVAAVAGCSGQDGGGDRRPAPEVRGVTLDGEPFDLAAQRGHPVVVNVWGSWCAPCKREQPDLQRAFTDAQPLGVRFLGLAVRDTAPNARAHLRRYGVGYPSILDEGLRLVARFRDLPPTAIPSTVVVDRDGRVAATFLGPVGYDELMPMLRRLAAEQ